MSVKFSTVKAGDKLYDVHSEQMGNTTMRRMGWWPIRVISVDHEARTAMVSWNGNPARRWFARDFEKSNVRRSIPKKLAGEGKSVTP